VPQKRSREEVDKGTMAKKVSNVIKLQQKRSRDEVDKGIMASTLDKEKQQTKTVDEENRMLETKIVIQDELIAKKAKLEAMKVQHEKRMLEAKILSQDKIISEQKVMLEAMKLPHENVGTELGNIDS